MDYVIAMAIKLKVKNFQTSFKGVWKICDIIPIYDKNVVWVRRTWRTAVSAM